MSLDDIKALDRSLPAELPFDYYCWDLYTRVGGFYRDGGTGGEPNPERLKLRTEVLHAIEAGNNSIAELADYVATRNVEQILDTMKRLGIRYESARPRIRNPPSAFLGTRLRINERAGRYSLRSRGPQSRLLGHAVRIAHRHDEHESDKIIVRSNGSVTYTGKDIAYQLWKLGRLGSILTTNRFALMTADMRHG